VSAALRSEKELVARKTWALGIGIESGWAFGFRRVQKGTVIVLAFHAESETVA
jgi:hypothetical protein